MTKTQKAVTRSDRTGRVVVGVDGSPASVEALREAARHARRTGATVEAVMAWTEPVSYAGYPLLAGRDWAGSTRRTLDGLVEAALGPEADEVTRTVLRGSPAAVLRERAAGADLLVVPRRDRRRAARLLLGPLGEALARRATCPVLAVG